MVDRLINPLKSRSFFLFGARGVGKSTWLRGAFREDQYVYINLLEPNTYELYLLNPHQLYNLVTSAAHIKKIIIIDEIQKVPALLDIAHDLISSQKRIFILTGSSARRLKQKGVNLLAGRASVYHLYPLSIAELGDSFNLPMALDRGLLPEPYFCSQEIEAHEFLKSYVLTYIEKEIQQEQWVRKIEPFRKFLQLATQANAKIVNKSKIAQQVGVEVSTVDSYYEILEDTLLGFFLPGYSTSIRKQVRITSKFYFIDTGILRAIDKTLSIPMIEHSSYYGALFETLIILEIKKYIEYHRLEWTLSYLCTKEDVEIDVVISRPRQEPLLIEIKSTQKLLDSDFKSLLNLGQELDKKFKKTCPKITFSQDQFEREFRGVRCVYYQNVMKTLEKYNSATARPK